MNRKVEINNGSKADYLQGSCGAARHKANRKFALSQARRALNVPLRTLDLSRVLFETLSYFLKRSSKALRASVGREAATGAGAGVA